MDFFSLLLYDRQVLQHHVSRKGCQEPMLDFLEKIYDIIAGWVVRHARHLIVFVGLVLFFMGVIIFIASPVGLIFIFMGIICVVSVWTAER